MQSLVKSFQQSGLSIQQIEQSLLVIEHWLDEKFPVLAKVYHSEMLNKAMKEINELKEGKQDPEE